MHSLPHQVGRNSLFDQRFFSIQEQNAGMLDRLERILYQLVLSGCHF
jgi:hypothetical protein